MLAPVHHSNLPACPLRRSSALPGLARSPISGRGWGRSSLRDRRSTSRIARRGSPGSDDLPSGADPPRPAGKDSRQRGEGLGSGGRRGLGRSKGARFTEGMDAEKWAGRVRGAAAGRGRATARALAAAGVKVAILDVNDAAAAEAAAETDGFAISADVTDAPSVEAAFAAARARHGPARIAVNCAGIGT